MDEPEELSNIDQTNEDSDEAVEQVYRDAIMYAPDVTPPTPTELPSHEMEYDQQKNDALQTLLMNSKPLAKTASTYELEKFEHKLLLIFNHINFVGEEPRMGTKEDVAALKSTFGNLGFTVKDFDDLPEEEIANKLKEYTKGDLSEYGCIAVAVLTHGTYNGMLKTEHTLYSEQMIIDQLKVRANPTLVTKPRIVIIQACRGEDDISAAHVLRHAGEVYRDSVKKVQEPYTLPMESDILVLHSSYAGNPAHRTDKGSWFIKALCKKIDELAATEDLESILTVVKRKVAIDKIQQKYNPSKQRMEYNKQMPVSTSTFTRKLYLKKFGEKSNIITSEVDGEADLSSSQHSDSLSATSRTDKTDGCISTCLVKRFMPMTECLKKYVADKPEDSMAVTYLELVEPLLNDPESCKMKRRLIKVISKHLSNETGSPYLEYLYDPESP
ncbi:caspase-4 [Aphomia sociella]